MKRYTLIILLLVLSVAGKKKQTPNSFTVSMGSTLYWYHYSEQFTNELYNTLYPDGTPLMTGTPKSDEYGPTIALSGTIENRGPFFVSFGGFFSFSGKHTYDGSTQEVSGMTIVYTPFKIKGKRNRFGTFELKSGYRITVNNKTSLTPFAGLRLQRWGRALGFSTKYSALGGLDTISTYDIKEIYHWKQFLLGLRVENRLNSTVRLKMEGSVDIMFSGSMEYDMNTDTYPQFDSATEVTLSNHPGVSFSLAIEKQYSERFRMEIAPFYRFRHFGLSTIGTQSFENGNQKQSFVEPESVTHAFGISVNTYFFRSN